MPQRTGALVVAAVLTLAGSGCTSDDEPAARAPATSTPAGQSPIETTPTTPATPAAPTQSAPTTASTAPSPAGTSTATATPMPSSPAGGRATGPAARLLPAADLPGFNQAFTWREQGTSAREPSGIATCNRFAVTSLGATRTATRTYVPAGPPGPRARHLVAQFPDEATAARAYDVLTAWHRQCRARLARHDLRRVGPLTPVPVRSGTAGWYLLTYGPVRAGSDDAVFESTGMARTGTRVALLDLRLVGQDFNYPPGREPMVAAVRRAAGLLP